MKRIPTLFGPVKCAFTLVILLFVAASATVLNETALSAAYLPIPNWTNELSG